MHDTNQKIYLKRFETLKSLINKELSSCKIEINRGMIAVSRLGSTTGRERNPRIVFNPDEDFMTDLDSDEKIFDRGIQAAKQILEDPPLKNRNFQGEILLTHQGAVFKQRKTS